MKTIVENIGTDPILISRAKAEAGDPKGYSQGSRNNHDIKVTLISREFYKRRQKTFYLIEGLGGCSVCNKPIAIKHPLNGKVFCNNCEENNYL